MDLQISKKAMRKPTEMERGELPAGKNSLKSALQPVLLLGKFIGVVPLCKTFRLSYIIMPMFGLNLMVELQEVLTAPYLRKSPYDLAGAVGGVLLYSIGLFVYWYLSKTYRKLEEIIKDWEGSSKPRTFFNILPTHLISVLVLVSAILENLVYHFKLCDKRGPESNFLDCTYNSMHVGWPHMLSNLKIQPATEALGLYLFFTNKAAVYAWNFVDVLIFIVCQELNKLFDAISYKTISAVQWPKLRGDYEKIMAKHRVVEEFLSPLIFISYGMNTYAMCMQLKLWLTPSLNSSLLDSVYSVWSSLQLLVRVGLVSISAAKVSESAKEVLLLTKQCPDEDYSLDIYRLERVARSAQVDLSGLKCFFINKAFLLTLIGVVFTFEIVLLQSFDANSCNKV